MRLNDSCIFKYNSDSDAEYVAWILSQCTTNVTLKLERRCSSAVRRASALKKTVFYLCNQRCLCVWLCSFRIGAHVAYACAHAHGNCICVVNKFKFVRWKWPYV